jgi:glycosyltransferase 2 family protein
MKRWWWLFLLPLSILLLVWSFRQAAFGDVLLVLRSLKGWEILALIGVNILLLVLFSARWWLILTELHGRLPYFRLSAYRLVGAAVSYVTPGPQFGGEPLQVALLGRDRVPMAAAVSSVILDRIIELVANFGLLSAGVLLLGMRGIPLSSALYLAPVWIVLSLPLVYLASLREGKTPLAWLLNGVAGLFSWRGWSRVQETAAQSERQMMLFFWRSPRVFWQASLVTLLVWAGMLFEYYLALRFLGISLTLTETVMAITFARLSFLTPLPAGLGMLEAGQVFAMEMLGYPAAAGLAVSAIIRTRDILIAVAGILVAIWFGLDWRKR